ncbi:MAG: 3-hydroxyacyl-ACP dehydratase FabZ family protein [Pirellulales bacterium]
MSTNASSALTLDEIKALIPHREPMLMIDEVLERSSEHIVCRRTFRHDEYFFQGHYPDFPLVPGVLLCEAAMQAGAVLLAEQANQAGIPVAARLNEVKFRRMVHPGDTITVHVDVTDRPANAYFMKARVMLGDSVAMRCEFACMIAQPEL